MKKNYTHITLVLDRSGSMVTVMNDVIGGIKQFIEEQQSQPGECTLTLVQFDGVAPYDVLYDRKPIKECEANIASWYKPRGWTPLLDAVGTGISKLGQQLAALDESERPEKVVFVTMTDGQENHSKEYSRERVSAMTKEQQEKYNWQFVYLGANHDAIKAAADIGIAGNLAAQYSEQRTSGGIVMTSAKLSAYRSGAASGMSWTSAERESLS